MQILHNNGFNEEKLRYNIPLLRSNTLDTIKILITACNDWSMTFQGDESPLVEQILSSVTLTPEVAHAITVIWNSEAVKKAYLQRHRIQLPGGSSTTEYFVEHAKRFAQEDFLPNVDDMLRVKSKTTGVIETTFQMNGTEFNMVDVGGQRSERKKMACLFQ